MADQRKHDQQRAADAVRRAWAVAQIPGVVWGAAHASAPAITPVTTSAEPCQSSAQRADDAKVRDLQKQWANNEQQRLRELTERSASRPEATQQTRKER